MKGCETLTSSNKYRLKRSVPEHQTQQYKDGYKNFAKNSTSNSKRKSRFSTTETNKSPRLKFDIDMVTKWLQNPVENEEKLRILSNYLYNTNPIYKTNIAYLANLPKYAWKLSINSLGSRKKYWTNDIYEDAVIYIDNMNLEHEMLKVLFTSLKEDWFYGYEIESDISYFILPLDPKYCRSYGFEDGVRTFEFNFSFFDSNKDLISSYPKEFQLKYEMYKDKQTDSNWIEIDSKKSICIKINEEIPYGIPYFASSIPSLLDLEFYNELKKDRAENDNFLLLHQRIPIDDKSGDIDKMLLSGDVASQFHQNADESLPKGVSLITSPMPIEAVKTEKSKNDNDYVVQGYRDVYTNLGTSQFLFNSDKNTSIGIAKGVVVNEQIVIRFLRQVERWINRKLKFKFPSQRFKFKFLDVTSFNQQEVVDRLLKLAQNGFPERMDVASANGTNPFEFLNDITLEEALGMVDKLVPLKTSHTQSGDDSDEGGRPTSSDDELSDSGQQSRDRDSDDRKVNG